MKNKKFQFDWLHIILIIFIVLFSYIYFLNGTFEKKSEVKINEEYEEEKTYPYLEDKGYEVNSIEKVFYKGDVHSTIQVEMIKSFGSKTLQVRDGMYYINYIYGESEDNLNYRVNIVEENQICFYKTTRDVYQSYLEENDLGTFAFRLIDEGICID